MPKRCRSQTREQNISQNLLQSFEWWFRFVDDPWECRMWSKRFYDQTCCKWLPHMQPCLSETFFHIPPIYRKKIRSLKIYGRDHYWKKPEALQTCVHLSDLWISRSEKDPWYFTMHVPSFPLHLQSLTLDIQMYDSEWQKWMQLLPRSLTKLVFSTFTNFDVAKSFPPGLTYLELGPRWNQPVEKNTFPPLLQTLYFGNAGVGWSIFIQPLFPGSLPPNLTHLFFSGAYDSPLFSGTLPVSLKKLHFGPRFNSVIHELPPFLTELHLPRPFSCSLPTPLPSSLEVVELGHAWNFIQDIRNTKIVCVHLRKNHASIRLPDTLHSLSCDQVPKHLPCHLVELHLVQCTFPIYPGVLPDSLRILTVSCKFNHPFGVGVLPCHLQELVFLYPIINVWNHPLDHVPDSLTRLELPRVFSHKITPSQFPNLVSLVLPRRYACLQWSCKVWFH